MDDQAHQSRQIHSVESAVGLSQSPFVYHATSSLGAQEQPKLGHFDGSLSRHQQHMHQQFNHLQNAQMIPQVRCCRSIDWLIGWITDWLAGFDRLIDWFATFGQLLFRLFDSLSRDCWTDEVWDRKVCSFFLQMIMSGIAEQRMRDVQAMHMQDQSFQFFQPLQGAMMQMSRVEDMHRAATGVMPFPVSTIFVSTEDKNCCLLDRGVRCNRPAGTGGFTHRIRDLVMRCRALLTEDTHVCWNSQFIQSIEWLIDWLSK